MRRPVRCPAPSTPPATATTPRRPAPKRCAASASRPPTPSGRERRARSGRSSPRRYRAVQQEMGQASVAASATRSRVRITGRATPSAAHQAPRRRGPRRSGGRGRGRPRPAPASAPDRRRGAEGAGQGGGVVGVGHEGGVSRDLGQRAASGANQRRSARHRFQRGQAERLWPAAWHRDDRGSGHHLQHARVRPVAGEGDAGRRRVRAQLSQKRGLRAGAGKTIGADHLGPPAGQARQRAGAGLDEGTAPLSRTTVREQRSKPRARPGARAAAGRRGRGSWPARSAGGPGRARPPATGCGARPRR